MSQRREESALGTSRASRVAGAREGVRAPTLSDAEAAEILARLRRATGSPGLTWARPPERIPAGHESEIYALALCGGSSMLGGPLVLRLFRAPRFPRQASFEAAVHEGLEAQGFAVPRVLAAEDAPPGFLLMERLPGRGLADGIEVGGGGPLARIAALAALLDLSWRLPERLAEATRALLSLDAGLVLEALQARGLAPEVIGFDRHLAALEREIETHGLEGLREGAAWLRRARPAEPARRAVCHGDLLPNLLFAGRRRTGVVDWSPAFVTVGDPAFEIANTRVMTTVPLPLPGPLRPIVQRYQRALVRRFERGLGPVALPTPERLHYYEAWRRLRTLVGASLAWRDWAAGQPLPERPDPWDLPPIACAVARRFAEDTGVRVRLPPPPSVGA